MNNMHKQKGNFEAFGLMIVLIWVYFVVCWLINVVDLTQCDYSSKPDANWKCEVVHIAGLVGPVAGITAWVGTDE